jgi:hypothetical protein
MEGRGLRSARILLSSGFACELQTEAFLGLRVAIHIHLETLSSVFWITQEELFLATGSGFVHARQAIAETARTLGARIQNQISRTLGSKPNMLPGSELDLKDQLTSRRHATRTVLSDAMITVFPAFEAVFTLTVEERDWQGAILTGSEATTRAVTAPTILGLATLIAPITCLLVPIIASFPCLQCCVAAILRFRELELIPIGRFLRLEAELSEGIVSPAPDAAISETNTDVIAPSRDLHHLVETWHEHRLPTTPLMSVA